MTLLIFTFERTASCDAVQYAISGGQFKDEYSISYAGGSQSPLVDNDPVVSSYNLSYGSLVISSISTVTLNVGDQVTDRDVFVNQGGNGCIQEFTHIVALNASQINNYVFKFNGTPLIPNGMSTSDTLFFDIDLNQAPFNNIGNGDACFDNGESVNFTESFNINGCIIDPVKHSAYWGCIANEICQQAAYQSGELLFGSELPNLTYTWGPGSGSGSLEMCGSNFVEVQVTNANTNAGASATDILMNLGKGNNSVLPSTYTTNQLSPHTGRVILSNFAVNGMSVPDVRRNDIAGLSGANTFVAIYDTLDFDPDGAGVGLEDLDGDGYYDDLGPGESFTFSYSMDLNPSISGTCVAPAAGFNWLGWEHTYVQLTSRSQCGSLRPGQSLDRMYMNFSDYVQTSTTTSPTDLDLSSSNNFSVTIRPGVYRSGTICGGGSTEIYEVRVPLPAGVTYDGVTPPNVPPSLNPTKNCGKNQVIFR